ncbi:hypothetical protein A7U60_g7781 [Sanghuangporus baumii]|uniref:Uncharacterized protein n=1 Tax=Sanghuangporus baumii TaxID=108892 RepID=A0A9Q5MZG6_SANBA|nr:hypothetical protein A7U60_g7781 [Sanghuangporus baumii]
MNSTDSPHDLHLDGTFGCAFIAGITTSALWGAWTVQLYYYCNHFWKTDKWWLRFHVLIVWAFDTTHQILEVEPFYVYLIKEFGNISYLSRLDSHLIDTFALTGFVNLAVQMLFVTRIWRFNTGAITSMLAIAAPVSGLVLPDSFRYILLCLLIPKVYTLVSGLVLPDSFLYILLCLIIPKVYTNSILALLNSRQDLRDELSGVAQGISIHTSQLPIHRAEATRSDSTMYGPQIIEDGKRNVLVGESGSSISQ